MFQLASFCTNSGIVTSMQIYFTLKCGTVCRTLFREAAGLTPNSLIPRIMNLKKLFTHP